MKTAVDRVGRGKERQVNIRFLAMTNYYVFAPEFCNPAAGWEKGQETPHGSLPGSIADVWADERAALMALPAMFDGFVEQGKRVSPTHCPAGDARIADRGPGHLRA